MLGLPEDDSPLALSAAQDTWSEALKGAEGTLRKLFISHTRVFVTRSKLSVKLAVGHRTKIANAYTQRPRILLPTLLCGLQLE